MRILLRAALACAAAGAVLLAASSRKIDPLPISNAPLSFKAESAYSYMARLSKGYPRRVTWSDERRKAAQWLKQELSSLGYEPKSQLFQETIAGKYYTDLENVYAEKTGTTFPNEIIAVVAHYDITDTTIEGAMDDGSGVGIVLELARVFKDQPTSRSMVFLLTDSEEFGAFWGARAFARGYERARQIVSVINIDFIAPEKQSTILTLCDGLERGFTPLWLRELALGSLRSVGGVKAADFAGVVEFVQRAVQVPAADHGAFLREGIPAFNWVGQTEQFLYEMTHYHHTENDVVEAMRTESFEAPGKAAERLIRSIDALDAIPADFRDGSYWKISQERYIPGWVATILQILAFVPFVAYSVVKFGAIFRSHPPDRYHAIIRNEAKHLAILVSSLLLGYVVLILLPSLKIIEKYEYFPATQKSLLLYTPNALAIVAVIGSIVAVFLLLKVLFPEPKGKDSAENFEIRHALHSAFLTVIIFVAFLKNSYLGALLLLPPAYFWMMLKRKPGMQGRLLNLLILAGGAITLITVVAILATIFHVGVAYWYLFLAASYGLVSAYTAILFFMALAVMIRLFRGFVLGRDPQS